MAGCISRVTITVVVALFATTSCEQRSFRSIPAESQLESKIINCANRCDEVARRLTASGGRVTARYRNFPLLAARANGSQLASVNALLKPNSIVKDRIVPAPKPMSTLASESYSFKSLQTRNLALKTGPGVVRPAAFATNTKLTGANFLHDKNITGKGIIVAVIDSGTANNPDVVPLLKDTVIGGENFVTEPDEPSATSTLNDDHGTWIGVMIAGHGDVLLPSDSDLATSISTHNPESALPADNGQIAVPVLGTAPDAKIYALKTFPANGDGSPNSRILATMDRVLTIKKNFLAGVPSEPVSGDGSETNPFVYDSLDIKVLNMSLGGPTLFPGSDIEDTITEQLLDAGITVVVAAGNEGFAAMTGSSPATSLGALAVGAASNPTNERILRDMQKGLGTGIKYRPTDFLQVALFSSRGPTADGRQGVHILANGHASFVQGANGNMSLVSGTSLSCPTIAGAAALLWNSNPNATARDIRTALIMGANATRVGGSPSFIDQGFGFVDLVKSAEMLAAAPLPEILPTKVTAQPKSLVKTNIAALGFRPIVFEDNDDWDTTLTLSPGQTQQFFVETQPNIQSLRISLEKVTPQLPKTKQNALFGDDVAINVIDAPISFDERRVREFTAVPAVYNVDSPQPGLVRVALMGDWTNVGNVTVELSITPVMKPVTPATVQDSIVDKQSNRYELVIEPATTRAELQLNWRTNWSFYPAHDLDLVLADPTGTLIFDGATLSSPEKVILENPAAGTWTITVDGFLLHDMTDQFQLRGKDQIGRALKLTPLPATP